MFAVLAVFVLAWPVLAFFEDKSHLLTTNPRQKNYGIAVTDINADGAFEFVVAGFGAANQAFSWDASTGKFKDIALGKAVLQDAGGRAIGVAACDIDGDGYEELYVLNTDAYSGQTTTSDRLLDRDGAGEYTDLFTEAQNLDGANYVAGRSCACVDRSGTGRYGVFVANYGGPMRLFEMSDEGRRVSDQAPTVGMAKTTGGRALIAAPLVTNRMDVFANNEGYGPGRRLRGDHETVAQNSSVAPARRLHHRRNFLFANNGGGAYSDIAAEVGLLDNYNTGRGTALLDANGDGLLDVVYGNWNSEHRLFIQEKSGDNCSRFVDKAPAAMKTPSRIRTVIVADFDNDGHEEIFWNNIPGANRLFRKLPSDSDWVQIDIGDALEENGYGTGAAFGDFDGDGRLELVVAHGESVGQPLTYFHAPANGHHWLRVLPLTLQGAPARGATVSLVAGGRTQLRVIDAGSGYLCQMEPVAHFGLGALTEVESLIVTWPDGAVLQLDNVAIDQTLKVSRPADLETPPFRGQCSPQIRPGSNVPLPVIDPSSETPSPSPQPGSRVPSPVIDLSSETPSPSPQPGSRVPSPVIDLSFETPSPSPQPGPTVPSPVIDPSPKTPSPSRQSSPGFDLSPKTSSARMPLHLSLEAIFSVFALFFALPFCCQPASR